MEERKTIGPFGVIGLVLLALALALCCFLAADIPDLSLGLGPWGVYATDQESVYLAAAYLQTDTRDILITDRRQAPVDGDLVTYVMEGRRMVDLYDDLLGRPVLDVDGAARNTETVTRVVQDAGAALRFLRKWHWVVWGVSAVIVLTVTGVLATAKARWRRRQQKLMKANFQRYGEKYRQEDEDMDY